MTPSVFICGHLRSKGNTTRNGRCYTCLAEIMRAAQRKQVASRAARTHFTCGHPIDAEHSTKERHPRCKVCERGRHKQDYKRFRCGHDVTPENVVMRGPFRRCRQCLPHQEKPSLKPPPAPPSRPVPAFEIVSVRPAPQGYDPHGGRSYSFPPRQRIA